jgi:hypothetical protein
VYDKTYAGPAEKKNEIIEALCRGENVEEFFDFNLVNCIDVTSEMGNPNGSKALIGLPDTWEESWDGRGLGTGTVAITTTMDVENGDHGGHPRVDILSIVKVEAPM